MTLILIGVIDMLILYDFNMSTRTQTITISASVLKWARITLFGARIDDAASKLKITRTELSEWESNNPTISLSQLKRISKIYKRHISVLLLETPPFSQHPPKFRKLPDFENATFEQSTFLAIREAQDIQNKTIFLLENKHNIFLREIKEAAKNPSLLATKVIELLSIDEQSRFKSRTSKDQLTIWKRLLESRGILVLELKFSVTDSRAFAIFDSIAPLIVLNSKDSDNARIFSLFHELGHIALGETDLDDDLTLDRRYISKSEILCNDFAAQILVPNDLLKKRAGSITNFSDDKVKEIANIFKVSSAVIWRRLRDERYISANQFDQISSKLSVFEPFANRGGGKKFGANKNTHLYIKIKQKGEFFISEVFEAFNQNRISYYDVLNYTGIKSVYLSRLQKLMYK